MSTTLQEVLQNLLGLLRNEGSKHGSKARNSEPQAWRVNVVFWILNPAFAPNGKPATSVVVRRTYVSLANTKRGGFRSSAFAFFIVSLHLFFFS
jgi:hypothetical protein